MPRDPAGRGRCSRYAASQGSCPGRDTRRSVVERAKSCWGCGACGPAAIRFVPAPRDNPLRNVVGGSSRPTFLLRWYQGSGASLYDSPIGSCRNACGSCALRRSTKPHHQRVYTGSCAHARETGPLTLRLYANEYGCRVCRVQGCRTYVARPPSGPPYERRPTRESPTDPTAFPTGLDTSGRRRPYSHPSAPRGRPAGPPAPSPDTEAGQREVRTHLWALPRRVGISSGRPCAYGGCR